MGDWWSEEIVQSAVVNQKLTEGVEHPAPFPEKIVYSTSTSNHE